MALTEHILSQARALKPAALQAVLRSGYGPARRIACVLSGDEQIGRAVADVVARRSLRFLRKWTDPSSPENWFYHHAVLLTREVNSPPPDPALDPLVANANGFDTSYTAFVRAIRHLPQQQREAFILHHGERLNSRLLGVVMDCSMQAARVHLQAATDTLDVVTGGHVTTLTPLLTRAYSKLREDEADEGPLIRSHVRRVRTRLWIKRIVRIAILLILAFAAVEVWTFRDSIRRLIFPA